MATRLGHRAERLSGVRALRTVKGRREQNRFAVEGPTMLAEAVASEFPIAELYVTEDAYDSSLAVRALESRGVPTYLLDEAAAGSISDLTTPSGIVAVAPTRLGSPQELLAARGIVLVLADVSDPSNAGTLLRSADAFGCAGVVFGSTGVDPYHPKVVRGSMGAIFRVRMAVAAPEAVADAATASGVRMLGLSSRGRPLQDEKWEPPLALVVGHERRGLERWEGLCERLLAIPMTGSTESLSAAVAGSIGLYEAQRQKHCQESI
jgi:RNA methyltransferase, TrmH family